MKTISASILLTLAAHTLAAPTPGSADFPAPPGGWDSIDYPDGTGENLPYYPPPPGGWENVDYPDGTGSIIVTDGEDKYIPFTSAFTVVATPDQVRNGTTPAPGQPGAIGIFSFKLNSYTDTICYDIFLINAAGDYKSPAKTATHVHEAVRGASGPPRIAFPNPAGTGPFRQSSGCLTAPFTTGLNGTDGKTDTGSGFKLAQIEANPAGFFADSHTTLFSLGVVRGQLA